MSENSQPIDPEVLLANAAWVRALAAQLVADDVSADDLVQDAWLAALEHPPRHAAALRTWLRAVVAHVASRSRRSASHRAGRERAVARPEAVPSSAELVERVDLQRRVVEEVVRLDDPYRSTVLLRFFEGLTSDEIARRTGVPASTVRVRLKRALERLRQRLDDAHGGDRRAWSVALLALVRRPGALAPETRRMRWSLAASGSAIVALLLVGWWIERPPQPTETAMRSIASTNARALAPRNEAPAADASKRAGDERLSPAAEVTGRVVDRDGRGVPGARVTSFPDDLSEAIRLDAPAEPARTATTDADGRFAIALGGRAPFHTLVVDAAGFAPAAAERVRPRDERTIALEPDSTLAGVTKDLEGNPIAGARVAWRTLFFGAAIERAGLSGADGTFRIDGLPSPGWKNPSGSYLQSMLFEADGWASQCLDGSSYLAWRDHGDHTVYLLHGATLRGRVVDDETEAPLAGARVVVWANDGAFAGGTIRNPFVPRPLAETTAAGDGTFAVEHVPAWGVVPEGDPDLRTNVRTLGGVGAIAAGHANSSIELELPDDRITVDVELRCPTAATIRGRVVDASGAPIANASIVRRLEGRASFIPPLPAVPFRRTLTDALGAYELRDVPALRGSPSTVRLEAHVYDKPYNRRSTTVDVPALGGECATAPDIVVSSIAAANVHVVDGRGRPVWGARIRLRSCGNLRGRTEESGVGMLVFDDELELRVPQHAFVDADGFATAMSDAFVPSAADPPDVHVVLESEHRLSGRVKWSDDRPAGDASVCVVPSTLSVESFLAGGRDSRFEPAKFDVYGYFTADSDGRFVARGLPAGPYHVIASMLGAAGYPRSVASDVPSDASDVIVELPAPAPSEPERTARVEGSIHDAETGMPILRFEVALHSDRAEQTTTRSAAPGRFAIESVPFGTWKLHATAPGYAPLVVREVVVGPDGTSSPLDLRLERGVTLRGRARVPEGATLGDAKIQLVGTRGGWSDVRPVSSDGTFTIPGLKPGWEYLATVWSQVDGRAVSYASLVGKPIAVPENVSEIDLELSLAAAGAITIEVRSEKLLGVSPVSRTRTEAQAELAAQSILEIRTADGTVAWQTKHVTFDNWGMALPAGEYVVRLTVPGLAPIEKRATISPSAPTTVDLDIP
jgi:RNA polymerase sigma factor (sigma-70 family)